MPIYFRRAAMRNLRLSFGKISPITRGLTTVKALRKGSYRVAKWREKSDISLSAWILQSCLLFLRVCVLHSSGTSNSPWKAFLSAMVTYVIWTCHSSGV